MLISSEGSPAALFCVIAALANAGCGWRGLNPPFPFPLFHAVTRQFRGFHTSSPQKSVIKRRDQARDEVVLVASAALLAEAEPVDVVGREKYAERKASAARSFAFDGGA